MGDYVACNDCGSILNEARSLHPEQRESWPNCGSKARKWFVTAEASVNAEATVVGVSETIIPGVSLLLQTIVIPAGKTKEGQLIEAVAIPWFEIIELLRKEPAVAYQIPWRKWEEIIAGGYKKAGFDEVTLTSPSGDYGKDIIATKRGIGSVRVIDQVKTYKPGHLVTANDVRALIGVLQSDGAAKGFLTTTSDFAPRIAGDPSIAPHMPSRLELINGKMCFRDCRN